MLSYRHAFHAGNFADLLKHLVLVEVLTYMTQKDKPFDYIDTHAGAGMYSLEAEFASKNKEYLNGIAHWFNNPVEDEPQLKDYLSLVKQFNPDGKLQFYPGSPTFGATFLRKKDKAWFFELHTNDFKILQENFCRNRAVHCRQEDGFKGLLALLPCQSHRAVVMIDPSYEIKEDYQLVLDTVCKAYKKMPNAVFAIWYPVVKRSRIDALQMNLASSGIRNIQQFELGICKDSSGFGMTSSGMLVINPPWTLFAKMQQLLPQLAERVSIDGSLHFSCNTLVQE